MFELRRGPIFELSGGLWPSRGESWVNPAGEEPGEARAEMMFELRRGPIFELKSEALRRGLSK